MTAEQLIKREILEQLRGLDELELPAEITAGNVDQVYGEVAADDWCWEAESEFRSEYHEETDIPCDYSRHYESKSVARKLDSGVWVGWTYWFGGGKHGEPGAVDWMNEAYLLTVTEEEKLVTVRTFARQD